MGIPHYKYGEEYPQIPYVEVMAQTTKHDLHFTYYPGTPVPGERVRFKLYVKDRQTGEPFRESLPVQIVQKTFFGPPIPVAERTIQVGVGPEKNDYKFFETFDAAEAFEVRVDFPDGERMERIPFPVTIGETDDRPLIFGAAGIVGLTVIAVAVAKRRRKRG